MKNRNLFSRQINLKALEGFQSIFIHFYSEIKLSQDNKFFIQFGTN